MARRTVIDEHPLLSQRAETLGEEELAAHKLVAESLLGLTDFTVSVQSDCDIIDAAVVMQVNYQVEAGVEGALMQEARRGGRHIIYRGRNRMAHTHGQALKMVHSVKLRLGAL